MLKTYGRILTLILLLSFTSILLSCSQAKPEEPVAKEAAPPVPADKPAPQSVEPEVEATAEEREKVKLYDLTFTVAPDTILDQLVGDETSYYMSFEQDEEGDSAWMEIEPMRPLADNSDEASTAQNGVNRPVLTEQTIIDAFDFEIEVPKVYGKGEQNINSVPWAYIDADFYSADYPEEVWRILLTRTTYNNITYTFAYAALPDIYERYLPEVKKIIASADFSEALNPGEARLWDIAFDYPDNGVTADIDEDMVYLTDTRTKDSPLKFYAKHDDSIIYSEDIFDDKAQTDRLLRIWSNDMTGRQSFRRYHNLEQKSLEETTLSGLRAIHAVYHDKWDEGDVNAYYDIFMFVYNYDLYILQAKADIGREAALGKFFAPILESLRLENPNASAPLDRPHAYSDTARWITDTYAILTLSNNREPEVIGGDIRSENNKFIVEESLYESWGIEDRKSSDETINELLEIGHRADFLEFVVDTGVYNLSEKEFKAEMKEVPKEYIQIRYMCENTRAEYLAHGEQSLLAWDYCRAISLYGMGYVAGYYTYREALEGSLPIALELQKTYASWEEMYKSYMAGFNFWAPDDVNDKNTENYKRTQIMEELIKNKTVPGLLPWDTLLTPNWTELSNG